MWGAGWRVLDKVQDWDIGCRTFGAGSGYGCRMWAQDQVVGHRTVQDRGCGIVMQGAGHGAGYRM